jgi:hypothetical protein
MGIINVGVTLMALKICCREPINAIDILYGFKNQPEKAVKIQAVLSGFSMVATLPAAIARLNFEGSGDSNFFTMSVILYIVGYATYAFISLVFSQVYFLLLDFEDKSASELLIMANRLMDGHKKRLFLLWLSFIPLLLLSLLTCCIGFIWVMPYVKVTLANFYMDLMQSRGEEG